MTKISKNGNCHRHEPGKEYILINSICYFKCIHCGKNIYRAKNSLRYRTKNDIQISWDSDFVSIKGILSQNEKERVSKSIKNGVVYFFDLLYYLDEEIDKGPVREFCQSSRLKYFENHEKEIIGVISNCSNEFRDNEVFLQGYCPNDIPNNTKDIRGFVEKIITISAHLLYLKVKDSIEIIRSEDKDSLIFARAYIGGTANCAVRYTLHDINDLISAAY